MATIEEHLIGVDDDGRLQYIDKPELDFLKELGEVVTKRASHVEPANFVLRISFHILRKVFGDKGTVAHFTRQWSCWWRVNMKPKGGPVLPMYYASREAALAAEVEWLETNVI